MRMHSAWTYMLLRCPVGTEIGPDLVEALEGMPTIWPILK